LILLIDVIFLSRPPNVPTSIRLHPACMFNGQMFHRQGHFSIDMQVLTASPSLPTCQNRLSEGGDVSNN
jgi:hypothetical protein